MSEENYERQATKRTHAIKSKGQKLGHQYEEMPRPTEMMPNIWYY